MAANNGVEYQYLEGAIKYVARSYHVDPSKIRLSDKVSWLDKLDLFGRDVLFDAQVALLDIGVNKIDDNIEMAEFIVLLARCKFIRE